MASEEPLVTGEGSLNFSSYEVRKYYVRKDGKRVMRETSFHLPRGANWYGRMQPLTVELFDDAGNSQGVQKIEYHVIDNGRQYYYEVVYDRNTARMYFWDDEAKQRAKKMEEDNKKELQRRKEAMDRAWKGNERFRPPTPPAPAPARQKQS